MKTINNYIILFLAVAFFQSCNSVKYGRSDVVKSLPGSFLNSVQGDSSNSAKIVWREFFKDPHLQQLIDSAVNRNLDLRATLQRIEASRASLRFAKNSMLPNVNAYAAYNQRRFGLYTMDGAGNMTTPIEGDKLVPINLPDYYLGLQTSWEVDLWGKLRSRKAAALSRYLSSVEGRNLVVTNLISDVAMSYYELLSLDIQMDIVSETIVLQENALELTIVQKESGFANKLAVEQFEAQLLNSRALQKEIGQTIVETENRINFLLGRYPGTIQRNKNVFFSTVPSVVRTGVPSDLLRYRPDVKIAEYDLMAANADVKSARAAFLPTFNITGTYGFQAYKTSLLFTSPESIAYNFLGGLTAPLINRNAIKAEFNIARSSQLEALYNYQKSLMNGYVEVYNELSNIKNLNEIYELRNRQVNLLAESIETSSELFKSRRATYLEVIVSQQNSLDAKLDLVNVKKRQFDASINLYKALGGGWIQ